MKYECDMYYDGVTKCTNISETFIKYNNCRSMLVNSAFRCCDRCCRFFVEIIKTNPSYFEYVEISEKEFLKIKKIDLLR